MNSIIKRAVKREKLKPSEINKLAWEEDYKKNFIFNKKFNEIWHRNMINNSINHRSKKPKKSNKSRKSKNFVIKKQHKCKPIKKIDDKDIDFQKIKKFREDLKKKYEWRTDFHKIFMEWDISKTGHVKVSDFVKMAKEVGYILSHKESALILALEDEKDKGYLIASELLRLIYNKGIEVPAHIETNPDGSPSTKKEESHFQAIKNKILKKTHNIRSKTKTEEFNTIVFKNHPQIVKKIEKKLLKQEKKVNYQEIIKIENLDGFNSLSDCRSRLDLTKIVNPISENNRSHSFVKNYKSTVLENALDMQEFKEILGDMGGGLNKGSEINIFAEQFKDKLTGKLSVDKFMNFLDEQKLQDRKAKGKMPVIKRSSSLSKYAIFIIRIRLYINKRLATSIAET